MKTPLSYLTNWRIRRAQKLLITDNSNISEIAAKVGYHSEAAFNRIFKSKIGQTPQYIEEVRFPRNSSFTAFTIPAFDFCKYEVVFLRLISVNQISFSQNT